MVIDLQTALACLLKDFPRLLNDGNFRQISAPTPSYNCIGWALGLDNLFVSPDNVPWHWWPYQNGDLSSEQALIDCFRYFAFDICEENDNDPGYDKVALYSLTGNWTHAAKVLDANVYYSKFGSNIDGYHSSGHWLSSKYGTVYKFMRRNVVDAQRSIQIRSTLPPSENYVHLPDGSELVHYNGHIYRLQGNNMIKIV